LIETHEVPACPVCGERERAPYATGHDYESQTCENTWRMVECRTCRHVWLDPRPAESELGVIYPPDYYAYRYESAVHPIALRAKAWLDERKLSGIVRAMPRAPQTFVDVGCGDGRYLRAMAKRGVPMSSCCGIELDEGVVAGLRGEGFAALNARVEDIDALPVGEADLLTMFHVIEHVDDPGAVVANIARWLSPDGLFALETPNVESLDARLFRDRFWGGYHFPRHWNLFRPSTIERLLADHGLEVVDVRYQTGHSFWMWSMHHRLRYGRRPRPRLAGAFYPFSGFLPLLVGFTGFDRVRAALGARTSAMLVLARRRPG
jgi:2-polyprenyl-3-methyl-5-hydroxy-6-metoxy-1,4-benzoquinol methylase